jgi:hypothetical protein
MEQQLVDRLRAMLHLIFPEAKDVRSNTQVTINCPICKQQGDPDYNRHMYISLGSDDKPPMFNCFRRSGHSGLLTLSNLEQLSNYSQYIDTDLMKSIEILNKRNAQFNGYRSIKNNKANLFIPKQEYSKISNELLQHKLNYLSNRLGIPFTYKMCMSDKIILSLYDFLRVNRIPNLTQEKYICDILDQYFLGFLTTNNTSIILRNTITKDISIPKRSKIHDIRYLSYKVYPNAETGYYIMPSECDILKPIEIHLAEGAFDIISVCYNLMGNDRVNKIYSSVGSKAYINLMKYFMVNLGLIDVVFHVYIDSTIEKDILEEISYYMKPLGIDVYIHINTFKGEKDFGVPKDRISHYRYKL